MPPPSKKQVAAPANQALDVQQCLANLPHFLREAYRLRRRKTPNLFLVDQTLLSAVKQMVQDGEKRKQYLGYMLASVLLDPHLGTLGANSDFFNKTILNALLQSISACLKKNEVLRSDQGAAALKAMMPILTLVYKHFD